MARSPLTLAAAITAAVPGAVVVNATALTAGGDGRNDSAVATLADGTRVVVRIPVEADTDAELTVDALALQALSDGVRALLDFTVPTFLGAAPLRARERAFVTTFIPGYLVAAGDIPPGRGVAASLGRAIAEIHSLPTTVVRQAGLPIRTAEEVRAEARRVMDEASATGRVPVRLMVRWREAIEDDALWRFEPTVTLGGAGPEAFVFDERGDEPGVVGVIDWHGMSVTDPAIDLQFLGSAPEAADSILGAYADRILRAPDEHVRTRARLHAELAFAGWLLHGRDTRDDAVMDDATALLDQLAEGVREHELRRPSVGSDIDDALAAINRVPAAEAASVDTSMQTDTYDPEDLEYALPASSEQQTEAIDPSLFASEDERAHRVHAAQTETAALDHDLAALRVEDEPAAAAERDEDDVAEAERAAQAAIARWATTEDPSAERSRRTD